MRTKKVYAAALIAAASMSAREAAAAPLITGYWTQNNSSVKFHINTSPTGTYDYRVCADGDWNGTTCTGTVKYAGRMPGNGGVGNNTTTVPNTEVEWQFADTLTNHMLYLEAVNALGPVPKGNLIDFGADTLLFSAPTCTQMSSPIAGADYGCTVNGSMLAINGQGDDGTDPTQVVANAYVVFTGMGAAPSTVPLPGQGVTDPIQVVFDSFDSSENLSTLMYQVGEQYQTPGAPSTGLQKPPTDGTVAHGEWGITNYTVNAQDVPWDILYSAANVDTGLGNGTVPSNPANPLQPVSFTRPFFRMNGFDDILLAGSNAAWEDYNYLNEGAAWNVQRNEKYASMAITPKVAADLSNDKMLHVTFEVDAQFFQGNRWASVVIAPANDAVASFRFDDLVQSTSQTGITLFGNDAPNNGHNTTTPGSNPNKQGLNNSNQALWVQFLQQGCDAALFDGPNNAAGASEVQAGGVNFIAQDAASDLTNFASSGAMTLPTGCTSLGQSQTCCEGSGIGARWITPDGTNGIAAETCYPNAFAYYPGYFESQTPAGSWPAASATTRTVGSKTYPVWHGLTSNAVGCSRAAGTGQVSNGRGLDNRSRFDVFLSAGNAATGTYAHLWIFEDGTYLADSTVMNGGLGGTPVALPFTSAKVYFVHYAYAIDDSDENSHFPDTTPGSGTLGPFSYWQSDFSNPGGTPTETAASHGGPLSTAWLSTSQNGSVPYSDHRHWDNMGFEVLPNHWSVNATTANLQALIATPTQNTFTSTH
jgi:hypothetical protein